MNYSPEYEKLPRSARWMEPDSPEHIGGRDTDLIQIYESLYRIIKNAYPINDVPTSITNELKNLKILLEGSEELIFRIIDLATIDRNNRGIN